MADGTEPTLQHGPNLLAQVRAQFHTPLAVCRVSAGAEATNIRRVTIQVMDRLKRDVPGRWVILVYLSPTSGGAPSSTGNTVAAVTGTTVLQTVTANAAYRLLTDENGQAQIDVTISGAASRFVSTVVEGKVRESAEIEWGA